MTDKPEPPGEVDGGDASDHALSGPNVTRGGTKRWRRRGRELRAQTEAWQQLVAAEVSPELLELVEKQLAGELTSREALATRLTAIITFAGALLALGVTLSATAAKAELSHAGRTLFSICFIAALALLVAAIARSLAAIRPTRRPVPNPALLRYYAAHRTPNSEIRADAFKQYGATLQIAGAYNRASARAARDSLMLVGAALLAAAVAALIIYFQTPWPKTPHNRAAHTKLSRSSSRPRLLLESQSRAS